MKPSAVRWHGCPLGIGGRQHPRRLARAATSTVSQSRDAPYRADSLTKNTPPDDDSSPMDVKPTMPLPKNG